MGPVVDDRAQSMCLRRPWLLVVATCLLWSVTGIAGAVDPRVERAQADLDAARAVQAEVTTELDRAAAQFETARAHADRLGAEAIDNRRQVADAHAAAEEADDVLRRRLLILFTRPDLRGALAPAGVLGNDMAETVHRVELVEQLTGRGAQDRRRADRALQRSREAEHNYRVVSAGVSAAVRVRRETAAELSTALTSAQQRVEQAEAAVRRAEAVVAAERAERARQQARTRQLAALRDAQAAAGNAGEPLPPVEGKICPLGTPNAFSDTWGASRSGGRSHQGVDMFAAYGTPVFAVANGTVRVSTNTLGGLSIHLTTADGDRYYYAHLSEAFVSTGQQVSGGQRIGAAGNSGNARSTPPHLHWEYHPGGGAAANPYPLAFALCRS